jgi:ligand-binding sensor domain-containing protein
MKQLLLWIGIGFTLYSCEKLDESVNINFNRKILDDYFVTSIAFDSEGNAWIGTFQQGLIKYTPDATTLYNSSNSIIPEASVIYDIAVDSRNTVWFSCDGLMSFNGENFTAYNTSNSPIPEDFVESIAIDSEDNVWITSCRFRQGGIARFNGVDWTVYTPENSELPVNSVKSIAIDNYDHVWLALSEMVSDACLVRIEGNSWTTYTGNDLGFTPYYFGNIRINSKNKVCGAIDYSLSSMLGNLGPQAFIFDGEESEQLRFDSISNIRAITVDRLDNIWCYGYQCLKVYHEGEWLNSEPTFDDLSIFVIEQAPDNTIWIGTGEGIYVNN